MAKAGTNNEIRTEANLIGEKSARFEKLLGLFSEKDQNFLIKASEQEFSTFLEKGGFPAEELLDARQSWISQGGRVQIPAQQAPENEEKQEKKQDQSHPQHPHESKEEEPPPTEEAPTKPKERLWGPNTNYSEPTPKPTINRPRITRQSFTQRVPNLKIQRRFIGGLNRGARSMGRASRAGGKIAGKAAQVGTKLAARGATALLSNPIGWVILGIGVLFLLVIFILVFFFAKPPEESPSGTCDTGVCYYLDGPDQVANGEDICYQISLIYDPTKTTTPINNITVYDDYPEDQTRFSSATGDYFMVDTTSNKLVAWDLSENQSTSISDPLSGCPASQSTITPSGEQEGFYFKLKLTPTSTNTEIVNSVEVRIE